MGFSQPRRRKAMLKPRECQNSTPPAQALTPGLVEKEEYDVIDSHLEDATLGLFKDYP